MWVTVEVTLALATKLVEEAAAGLNQLTDKEAWALLARGECRAWTPFGKALIKLAKGDRGRVLADALLQELTGVADWEKGAWDKDALELWQKLGVDLEAEEAKRAPKPELPLKTEAKQKELPATPHRTGKTPGLTTAARARIVAAQRARWAKIKSQAKG